MTLEIRRDFRVAQGIREGFPGILKPCTLTVRVCHLAEHLLSAEL